jgi:hypothetical protein
MPHFMLNKPLLMMTLFGSVFLNFSAQGQDYKSQNYKSRTPSYNAPSTNFLGVTGLNLIPSSRHDKIGTIRLNASTLDPYIHTSMGVQIAEPLYLNFRQSYEVPSFDKGVQRLYPGLDFKLRLIKESGTRPEVSFGADSALGQKRHASEYIVFSKRKNNFDFTGGVAWGRLAGKGHIKNPLAAVSHFDEARDFDMEDSQNISDWFKGEKIGFFGGVEYFTPVKGLSFKADYAPIDGAPEQIGDAGFDAPPPWSVGFNYKPFDFKPIDIAAGIVGGDKIFARLSLQGGIQKWLGRTFSKTVREEKPLVMLAPRASGEFLQASRLNLTPNHFSTPMQVGHMAVDMANKADPTQEVFDIALHHKGLKGPSIKMLRGDLEKSVLQNQKTSAEIWHRTSFENNELSFLNVSDYFKNKEYKKLNYRFILDNKISFAEQSINALYRIRLKAELEKMLPLGLNVGVTPVANVLHDIVYSDFLRVQSDVPVRSDEEGFALNAYSIDRLYASWLYSVNKDLHIKLSAGYLEEQFGGYGGEILYRPFGKKFAIGGEAWSAKKRDSDTYLQFVKSQEDAFTGHLNFFYELPNQHTTLFAKAGQYLGEDLGATFGIKNDFKNGTRLEAFITATNQTDKNIFDEDSSLYAGARLTLPIGNVPYVPQGSEVQISTAPFARDAGQILDAPDKLYDVTEPISYRHLSQNWSDLVR